MINEGGEEGCDDDLICLNCQKKLEKNPNDKLRFYGESCNGDCQTDCKQGNEYFRYLL